MYMCHIRYSVHWLQMSSSDRTLLSSFRSITEMADRLNLPRMIVVSKFGRTSIDRQLYSECLAQKKKSTAIYIMYMTGNKLPSLVETSSRCLKSGIDRPGVLKNT